MKVTIPYNIDDKIETTLHRTKKLVCPVCKGKYQVVIKGETFKCPSCHGQTLEEEIKESIEVAISDIFVTINNLWDKIEIETTYEIVKPIIDNEEVCIDNPQRHYAYI